MSVVSTPQVEQLTAAQKKELAAAKRAAKKAEKHAQANQPASAEKPAEDAEKPAEAKVETTPSTRLHAHEEGDAPGSRRCTYQDHDDSVHARLFDSPEDGKFYAYPEVEGKPRSYGSWCGACRSLDAKIKREARKAGTNTPKARKGSRRAAVADVTLSGRSDAVFAYSLTRG